MERVSAEKLRAGRDLRLRLPHRAIDRVDTDGSRDDPLRLLFGGVLQVTESAAFHDALVRGIGPAKAYGFGLLSLAPVSAGV